MRRSLILLPALALMACEEGGGDFVLGGPGGSGGGGGGGSSDVFVAYDADLASVAALDLTDNMPASSSASYAGQVFVDIDNGFGADLGRVVGDLALDVDFDSSGGAVSGSVTNLAGETATGDALAFDGSLTTQTATAAGFGSSVTTNDVPNPPGPNSRSGALFAQFLGDVDQTEATAGDSYDGTVLLILNGAFRGDAGAGLTGTSEVTAPLNTTAPFEGDGTFYASQ